MEQAVFLSEQNEFIRSMLVFGKRLEGINYKWITGNEDESDDVLYCNRVPPMEHLNEKGISSAGLINLLRNYVGCTHIPHSDDASIQRGGIEYWYRYFEKKGSLKIFDYTKSYPLGTLFLRRYKSFNDQGHLAVLIEHYKNDERKTLYGKIIHAYAYIDSSKCVGQVGMTRLGMSHFCIQTENGEGYYEYAITPRDWLFR